MGTAGWHADGAVRCICVLFAVRYALCAYLEKPSAGMCTLQAVPACSRFACGC